MSMGVIIANIFGALWVWGWLSSIFSTSVSQEPNLLKKIWGAILLFFIWPYIALCMANQGDI